MLSGLFSESLAPFYNNILSLPTVFFTFFVIVSVAVWLLTVIGLVGFDSLEIDVPSAETSGTEASIGSVLVGFLSKLGLAGIPVTITITLVSIIGWLISYYISYFLISLLPPGLIKIVVSLFTLVVLLGLSFILTSIVLHPLKKFFIQPEQKTLNKIIGKTAVVRTSRVDPHYGEAVLDDSGAGLILKVRSFDEKKINLGDKIVILDYLERENAYHVILESDFHR